MFNKSKTPILIVLTLVIGMASFVSCKKDKEKPKDNTSMNDNGGGGSSPQLASTPLYDTLGWFIQGANVNMAIEGQGTKMISDPNNAGQTIQAGRLAIRTVVNKSLQVIAGDTTLAKYFPTLLNEVGNNNTTGFSELLKNFTDFVQQAVSGQEGVYTGLSMKKAHNHATYSRFGSSSQQYVTDSADFDKFVGDIAQAAQSLNVPNSVIGQLGDLLYTTEGDIVH